MTSTAPQSSKDNIDLIPGKAPEEMPEKASKKQLFIRRALEDRNEKKMLEALSEDNYWDNL